jgi:hypothetical protein
MTSVAISLSLSLSSFCLILYQLGLLFRAMQGPREVARECDGAGYSITRTGYRGGIQLRIESIVEKSRAHFEVLCQSRPLSSSIHAFEQLQNGLHRLDNLRERFVGPDHTDCTTASGGRCAHRGDRKWPTDVTAGLRIKRRDHCLQLPT